MQVLHDSGHGQVATMRWCAALLFGRSKEAYSDSPEGRHRRKKTARHLAAEIWHRWGFGWSARAERVTPTIKSRWRRVKKCAGRSPDVTQNHPHGKSGFQGFQGNWDRRIDRQAHSF